ncbi:MAG TPA: radical SAM protein, partial [Candidatus Saccharimonadales bacterium]|nr:radical SAM protein [Candidatus Saccharimonadales bacterium]
MRGDVIPFTEFVRKGTSRCDLQPRYVDGVFVGGCDYVPEAESTKTGNHGCYEYANDLWKDQDAFMSDKVDLKIARRIGTLAADHGLPAVRIIDHGGEPLLRPAEQIDAFSTMIRHEIRALSPNTEVYLGMTTNGMKLTDEKLAVLKKHEYSVSLSMDGDRIAHDRHRRNRHGGSTYEQVVKAATLLRESGLSWRILAVVDTDNDPTTVLDALASHQPPSMNLLLPHANHSVAPQKGIRTHGEWLTKAFNWYFNQPGEGFISIPYFDNLLDVLLGGMSKVEAVGDRFSQELFFLPNGDIQRVDTIKATEPGAVTTTMNVFDHSLEDVALRDPGIRARRLGRAAVADECKRCPLLEKGCGGGYYPHRFKALGTRLKPNDPEERFVQAFRNPSAYCSAQKQLITHIAERLEDDLVVPRGSIVDPKTLEPMPVNAETVIIDHPTYADIGAIMDLHVRAMRDSYINPELGATPDAVGEYTSSEPFLERRFAYWQPRVEVEAYNGNQIFFYTVRDPNTRKVLGFVEAERSHKGNIKTFLNKLTIGPLDTITAFYMDPDFQDEEVASKVLVRAMSHLGNGVGVAFTDRVKGSAQQRQLFKQHGFTDTSWAAPLPRE